MAMDRKTNGSENDTDQERNLTQKTQVKSHKTAHKKGLPKYLHIMESLRSSLQAGKYKDGARLPSEAELVRRFNVSRMTVVKAMQQLRQEGLLVRRAGSGSYASESRGTQKPVFGLIIPDLGETEIFEPICKGMTGTPNAAHTLAWGHSQIPDADKQDVAGNLCSQYIEQKVAGVFFAPVEFGAARDQVNRGVLQSLRQAGIPVVLLDRCVLPFPQRSDYDLVGLDNRRAGYIMADHLIQHGARKVVFFAVEGSAETVDDRIAGYREALFAHGLPLLHDTVVRGDPQDATAVSAMLAAIHPEAILCANDHTAAQLMHTLLGLGVRIPQDVRLAGIDDVRYAGLLPVPLTTFRQPVMEIGAAAIAAMLDRIGNPHLAARSILLNGRLVVRKSCGAKTPA